MPRINLLPVKAKQRRVSAQNEMLAMAALLVLTLAGIFVWDMSVDSEIADLEARIADEETKIESASKNVAKVEDLKKKEKKVKKKLNVIKSLVSHQTGPAKMLDEIAVILTRESKRVWLVSLQEKDGVLRLTGGAMDHEDISEFQLALERRDMFSNIRLERVSANEDTDVRFLTWELMCNTTSNAG